MLPAAVFAPAVGETGAGSAASATEQDPAATKPSTESATRILRFTAESV